MKIFFPSLLAAASLVSTASALGFGFVSTVPSDLLYNDVNLNVDDVVCYACDFSSGVTAASALDWLGATYTGIVYETVEGAASLTYDEDLGAYPLSLSGGAVMGFTTQVSSTGVTNLTMTLSRTDSTGDDATLYLVYKTKDAWTLSSVTASSGTATLSVDLTYGLDSTVVYALVAASGSNTVTGTFTLSATYGSVEEYVSSASVPEPATSTLGLLALAGFAARRRRR